MSDTWRTCAISVALSKPVMMMDDRRGRADGRKEGRKEGIAMGEKKQI